MPHTVKLIPGQDTWFPTSGTQKRRKIKEEKKKGLFYLKRMHAMLAYPKENKKT